MLKIFPLSLSINAIFTYTVARPVLGPLPLSRLADLDHWVHSLTVQLGLSIQIHHIQPEDVRRLAALNAKVEPCPVAIFEWGPRTVWPCPNVNLYVDSNTIGTGICVQGIDRWTKDF